ncbi:PREDICTED: putative indole-3-acetic acid-amido synthetase GH3.9 [Tarenaya hassleriana]|uniref:putative indole-3-acetic acid-amido synthetase GH3.9 n=1 Tax=Tarenaya hassleriana TaxID=28532 RepID=UPI00053C247D|nr:PREDICTED: putative indole-3-acetic acid-amido synthetase GH3.9 [Tarenaya hassleriana]
MDKMKLDYRGKNPLKELERITMNAAEVQEHILQEILGQNKDTQYLSKYMKGSEDISEFKRSVPVIKYKDIYPYIQRIANGEDSSLVTGHPITEILCSSGTSAGEPKLMPSIAEDLDRRTFLYSLIMPIVNQYIPGLDKGKAMYLYFVKAETSTPGGLPVRAVLTSYYKSKHFKCRPYDPFNDLTSPIPAVLCEDSNQSMYCQLLSGLVHRHQVMRLGAVFASAFLRAISYLERRWLQLCRDIREGELDPMITDPGCRSSMSTLLESPNPGLADEIEEICRRSSWKGILYHLWPRAKFIEAVVTGSMAQYIPALQFYSGGKLPLVCPMYASSESYFGVNLKPLSNPADVAFTLLPNMCYFEFIPLGENGSLSFDDNDDEEVSSDKVVDLVDVKLGCYYELVVTTFAGLCRYRMGDVLQVAGFYNTAPQFRFICRRNVVLSVDNDKTNEEDLHRSITLAKKFLESHNALLVEYTSYVDTSSVPGHYVLFWEIQHHSGTPNGKTAMEGEVIEECCISVEEELDYIYRQCRSKDRSVGPLEIRVVEGGSFEALMDLIISQGGSINQYKTPRCVKSNSGALKLLNGRVIGSFFSPRDPIWVP